MTREEELDWLCRLRSEIYVYMPKEWLIPMNNSLDMAIKALKQYGVLQEIRTEIEKPLREERYFDTADAKAQYIALNWVCELIDKHIKEFES